MNPHGLGHPHAGLRSDRGRLAAAARFLSDRFLLLPIGAVVALLWANTASESYFRFALATSFVVNEVLMALFLGLIALELWEALMPGGILSTWRRWSLPIVGAMGGAAGAVTVYLAYVYIRHEPILRDAWPVVCAIDIAAAYYVVKTIAPRTIAIPFVLLLAAATDAIALAAVLPHSTVRPLDPAAWLLGGVAFTLATRLRRWGYPSFWRYLIACGIPLWFAFYRAGLHPALCLVPLAPFLPGQARPVAVFEEPGRDTPVHAFEHAWNHAVQLILFLFGLVNAGVLLHGYGTGTWAVLAAAVIGRPLGIMLALAAAGLVGLRLPAGTGWGHVLIVAFATSSGFTFALFFAQSVIPFGPILAEIKLGALATVIGAAAAFATARWLRVSPRSPRAHAPVPAEGVV